MLKRELEERLNQHMIASDALRTSAAVDKTMLKSAAETAKEFGRLQKHVSDALVAITAIAQINCVENVMYQTMGVPFDIRDQMEREGKEPPKMPEITPLYASLMHIESILHRRIEKDEEPGYSRFR